MAEDLSLAACQHLPASLADRVALYLSNQLPSYSLVIFPGGCGQVLAGLLLKPVVVFVLSLLLRVMLSRSGQCPWERWLQPGVSTTLIST
jgi:hypothetical protein